MVLTFILLIIGVMTVYSFPLNSLAISMGMFLLAVSILSFALHIYFPPTPKHVVLRVVEPVKTVRMPTKPRKVKRIGKKARKKTRGKTTRKTKKTRKSTGKTRKRRKRR